MTYESTSGGTVTIISFYLGRGHNLLEHMLGRTTGSKHFFTRKIVRAKAFFEENGGTLFTEKMTARTRTFFLVEQ